MDQRLAMLREHTGGPFTRRQAVAAGYSPAEIRRLLFRGQWVVLLRGIYVEAELLAVIGQALQRRHALDVAAVLLGLECQAAAATTSAARILGLEFLTVPPPGVVVVSGDPRARVGRRNGYALRGAARAPPTKAVRRTNDGGGPYGGRPGG
jgi:putative AbiEi antitoxin of type IV toxin-antitoxin system